MIVTGANYRSTSSRLTSFATALLAMSQCISSAVDNLSASSPKTRQVIQRNSNNQADVRVIGSFTGSAMRLEARAVVMVGATNNGISTDWVVIVNAPTNGPYAGTLTNITAGGWYRIEVRAVDANTNVTLTAAVDRVGVGDIFVTAGQSNAACYGNPLQVPNDDRVSAFSFTLFATNWQFAKDPQPNISGGMATSGSPWPILGSLLVASNQVPVGFVGLAYGGTSISQWLPGTSLYRNISNTLVMFGSNGVRAVLWHQGESDTQGSTPTSAAIYAQRLSNIVAQSRVDAGWSVPWGIAEVGYYSVGSLAGQESVAAGHRLGIYTTPNCFRGARTDDFKQEGKLSDGIHFNAAGLADHAQQWADVCQGVEDASVKNGNFESDPSLLDGRLETTTRVVGWNRVNATGDSATVANSGYYNPNASYYTGSADSLNGGVLTNMNGRHVGTIYGGTAAYPSGDAFLQTLRAHLQPSTIHSLQVAVGVRNGGFIGGYKLDILTNGVPYGAGVTGNLATLNSLAGGSAIGKFTVVSCVVTSAVSVASNQQLAIRILNTVGAGTYLDIDDVRLVTQLTPYGQWQMTNWSNLFVSDSLPEANPDGDSLPNLIEFHLAGANPIGPTPMPLPVPVQVSGEDYWRMQLLKNPAATSGAIEFQMSYDLNSWFTPVSSGNGDVLVTNNATEFKVQLRRSATPMAFFKIVAHP